MDYGLHSMIAGAGGSLVGIARVDRTAGWSELVAAGAAGAVHGGLVYSVAVSAGARPFAASVIAFGWGIWHSVAPLLVRVLEARRGEPTPAARGAAAVLVKFLSAPASTALGVGLGLLFVLLMRVVRGTGRVGFRDGVITFQAPRDGSAFEFKAVAFGAAVIFSCGDDRHRLFEHERFHTLQYAAMGDGLAPVWLTLGALWGGLTAAASGRMSIIRGVMASDGVTGNPIERGAVRHERLEV